MSTWYRKGEVDELGPFSLDELQYLRARGELKPDDLVRNAHATEWVLAGSVHSLFTDGTVPLSDALRPRPRPGQTDPTETEGSVIESPPVANVAPKPSIRPTQQVVRGAGGPQMSVDTEDNETWKRFAIGSGIAAALILLMLLILLLFFAGSGLSGSSGEEAGLADASGQEYATGEGDGGEASSQSQRGTSGGARGAKQEKRDPASQPEPDDFKPLPDDKITIKRIDAPTDPPGPNPRVGGGGGATGGVGSGGGSEFFGVRARGNKFVYVVDCSTSMRGPPFRKACEELLTSINGLKGRQMFYVFFFSDGTYRMFDDSKPKLLRANTDNKKRASDWVSHFTGGGGTSPRDAMLQAVDMKPDVIFLLSDGAFQDGTEDAVRLKNKKKAMINTIGFMYSGSESMLRKIADENRGEYRFVP